MFCHKYILINNQQTYFTDYVLSSRYYSSQEKAEEAINEQATEYCFRVVKRFPMSKRTGRIAEMLTEHERLPGSSKRRMDV